MKKLSALILLFSSVAQAAPSIKLSIKLTVGGKKYTPVLITNYGQAASVEEKDKEGNGIQLNVVPNLAQAATGETVVKLNFALFQLEKGTKSPLGTPEIITHLNDLAKITQKQDAKISYVLEVNPTEQKH